MIFKNKKTNWNRFFAYLKFLRWFKFYQYFFIFLFLVISTYYFFNKQIHYVRKEWSIYDSYFSTSTIGLEPNKYYYVSWDNETYYLVYIIVDGEVVGNSNIGNFYTSTRKPSDVQVHVFQRQLNPLNLVFSVREIKVEEVNYIDSNKYISIDTLKYYIHRRKHK
jgi:hypothetical protein